MEEIAGECGFNSTSHFITTFKKNVDISPKQFRNIFY
ncbi:AraC family transcriptional regulator [Oceanobacillus sp. CFH 90083]